MILHSVRLEGLGCFPDAFTAGPFAPGINVLYAPNATGKTTLFRAVSLAFLEPHRAKSADVQALRPWGRHLVPQVAIEFEHSGRVYRVRKRFLEGASAHLETHDGDGWTAFAQGDGADEFLRELLHTESEKPRSANRHHWGLAQVLWTTQGDLSLPPLSSSVIDSIRGSIGAQLAARDSKIEARVQEEYQKYFSPGRGKLKSGRNAAPLAALTAERDRIAAELQGAEELLRQFEAESGHIEQTRAARDEAVSQHKSLAGELERVRSELQRYDDLRSRQKERLAMRDAAETQYKALRERIDSIVRARRQVADMEQSLQEIAAHLPALTAEVQDRDKSAAAADQAHHNATEEEARARAALKIAQLAGTYMRSIAQHGAISQRLEQIAAAQGEIQAANDGKAGIQAPSEAQLRELRSMQAQETDAMRRLEMARIAVVFEPERRVEIEVIAGEQPGAIMCDAGSQVLLAGAPNLTFTIPGIGRFAATGPLSDYEGVRRELSHHRTWLAEFVEQFGSSDPDILEARRQAVSQLDAKIQQARRMVSTMLAGNSEADLRALHARLCAAIQAVAAEYPDWTARPPDEAVMTNSANEQIAACVRARDAAESAARLAHAGAANAQQQLTASITQQSSLTHNLAGLKELLAGSLADGLTDEQRRELLDKAALAHDSCRIALEHIEAELKGFAEDPKIAAARLQQAILAAEREAQRASEELVRAETRIQALIDSRPYDALTNASERLAIVCEQCDREQRRMDALALLHMAFENARERMMAGISAPVERIATDYLEEICGGPVAEIRLSQTLAAERVIPAALMAAGEAGVEVERLSGGEREQIFLCTRIALGSELARRERQMVVLDDVLTSTDDERMDRICRLLSRVCERLQVIILTCHPERFANAPGANRIDLAARLERHAGARVRA